MLIGEIIMKTSPQHRSTIAALTLFVSLLIIYSQLLPLSAQPSCDTGLMNAPNTAQSDLDHSVEDWGVYCENTPLPRMQNVSTPSTDGESLECAILGGVPYSNVHCYRNLDSEPDSAMFTLDMNFWFTETTCNNVD